jgi:patatin-like phospholipase/acyl hydrolase
MVSFVVACRADDLNNQIATHLRTYNNPQLPESFSDCMIWQAARATCAAPTYFRRMKIGKWEYVDGGLGFNNPTLL